MLDRLQIGVVGAGFVAQVVHLPELARHPERFAVTALADPDGAAARRAAARFGLPRVYEDHVALLEEGGVDAIVVCSPDATHAAVVLDALAAGVHVLVEKPLCLTLEDADRIVAASAAAGRVVQVGCMKRFDPAYEALLDDLRAAAPEPAHVASLTFDPGLSGPFAPPGPFGPAAPSAPELPLPAAGRDARPGIGGFDAVTALHGALVHDADLVLGALDALGIARGRVRDAFAREDGSAAGGTVELENGARWTLAWLALPAAGTFAERIELLAGDGVRRLEFPAPYLRQAPTRYTRIAGAAGESVRTTSTSWRESYERQLVHFHAAATGREPCRVPAEVARETVALLTQLQDAARPAVAA